MNHYPIAISDTGALDLSAGNFIADTFTASGLLAAGITVGGGALIGGKKHRAIGALIGLGVLYGMWASGSKIIEGFKSSR